MVNYILNMLIVHVAINYVARCVVYDSGINLLQAIIQLTWSVRSEEASST
jgi:hypothetical protein